MLQIQHCKYINILSSCKIYYKYKIYKLSHLRQDFPCTGKSLFGHRLKIPCTGKAVTKERAAIGLPVLCDISVTDTVSAAAVPAPNQSPYSSQLRMSRSSSDKVQKALMKALARRALVISGIFRSMAARRIL